MVFPSQNPIIFRYYHNTWLLVFMEGRVYASRETRFRRDESRRSSQRVVDSVVAAVERERFSGTGREDSRRW